GTSDPVLCGALRTISLQPSRPYADAGTRKSGLAGADLPFVIRVPRSATTRTTALRAASKPAAGIGSRPRNSTSVVGRSGHVGELSRPVVLRRSGELLRADDASGEEPHGLPANYGRLPSRSG